MSARSFLANLRRRLGDPTLSATLSRSLAGTRAKRAHAVEAIEGYEALRDAASAARDLPAARREELVDAFAKAARAGGFRITHAATAAEACAAVGAILAARGVTRVVKGKSMISEEIGLNEALARGGVEATETDLGEWIVQLRGEAPSHITAPALHLNRDQVRETFAPLGYAGTNDPATLAGFAREKLRAEFLSAGAGICGANLALADAGRILLVENEGNGGLVTSCPPVLVILAGIDRIVATLDQALLAHRLLTANATGQAVNAYTHLLSGDGAQERHIVLVDNGRRALLASPFAPAAACIRCGACMVACPVYARTGGHGYGAIYPGPIGIAIARHLLRPGGDDPLPYLCTLCGRCDEVCPVKIPLSRLVVARRGETGSGKGIHERLAFALHARLCERPALYHLAGRIGRALVRLLSSCGGARLLARLRVKVPPARSFRDACGDLFRDSSRTRGNGGGDA